MLGITQPIIPCTKDSAYINQWAEGSSCSHGRIESGIKTKITRAPEKGRDKHTCLIYTNYPVEQAQVVTAAFKHPQHCSYVLTSGNTSPGRDSTGAPQQLVPGWSALLTWVGDNSLRLPLNSCRSIIVRLCGNYSAAVTELPEP